MPLRDRGSIRLATGGWGLYIHTTVVNRFYLSITGALRGLQGYYARVNKRHPMDKYSRRYPRFNHGYTKPLL